MFVVVINQNMHKANEKTCSKCGQAPEVLISSSAWALPGATELEARMSLEEG